MSDAQTVNGVKLSTKKTREMLNPRQLASYQEHRRDLITWMQERGKVPWNEIGYAHETVKMRASRLDLFYRLVWHSEERYTEDITTDHADAWMRHLADRDVSQAYRLSCQKAAMTLFRWKSDRQNKEIEWVPAIRFKPDSAHNPRDILTREERRAVREAALEFGSVPSYTAVTPQERQQWKAYLAQKYGKPMSEIGPRDWERANSWKTPSLIWTAMDAGLRPCEVARSKVQWVDVDNGVLRIPKEESSKNTDNWRPSLLERTTFFLQQWLDERELRDKYEDSDVLWATRYGNPYGSRSLNRI